jgi:hypothetical protein
MTKIYHKGNVWEVKYCNEELKSKKSTFHALVYAKMEDFDLEESIVLEYKSRFYICSSFGIRESISNAVELYLSYLVDETRDIKIKLINGEKI